MTNPKLTRGPEPQRNPLVDPRRLEAIVDRVFGNVNIEHPEITREFVRERIRLRLLARTSHVGNRG